LPVCMAPSVIKFQTALWSNLLGHLKDMSTALKNILATHLTLKKI